MKEASRSHKPINLVGGILLDRQMVRVMNQSLSVLRTPDRGQADGKTLTVRVWLQLVHQVVKVDMRVQWLTNVYDFILKIISQSSEL